MSMIPNVGAVPDVVTNTLIATDWGNAIGAASRGRVVQRFNSLAERDASITAPVAGMLCYVLATDLFYGYRSSSGWTVLIGGPRDTMHAKVYRNAALVIGSPALTFTFDTVAADPMGLWVPGTSSFTVGAGVWAVTAALTGSAVGTGQALSAVLVAAGAAVASGVAHSSFGYGFGPTVAAAVRLPGGGTIALQSATNGGNLAMLPGPANCFLCVDYLGTG